MLERSTLHYRVASYIPSDSRDRFTNLSHFYHLHHQLHFTRTTISALISRIKLCVCRVTCLSDVH